MKKKTLTALALGAATVATGMASNVHADNVTVTKQQIGDETKITTTTTKKVNQQKVVQDKQAIASQQKVVNSAKSSLDRAKANASSTSQAVSSAQSNVNNAKKTLDEVKAKQPSQIKQQVAQDQNQVAQDKQSISATQSSITTDKNNINKDQQAINNVGQKAQQDQNKLNNDQSKLSNAQSTLNNDQGKLNDVNKQLSNLQNQNQNYPEIYVTQSGKVYLQAVSQDYDCSETGETPDVMDQPVMKDYLKEHNLSPDDTDVYFSILDGVSVKFPDSEPSNTQGDGKYLNNDPVSGQQYLNNGNDVGNWTNGHNGGYYSKADDYQVNMYNLTADQRKELNIFATELINEFRAEIGLSPLKLTQTTLDVSEKVAQGYNVDNWAGMDKMQHDTHAIDAAGAGLESMTGWYPSDSKDDDNFINTMHPNASHLATHMTMNNLKTIIADAVVNLLRAPDGHAQMFMNPYDDSIGVSIDKYGDLLFDVVNTKNGETNLVATNNSASQIANLQNQVNQLQSKVNADKQAVSDLTNKINADKAQLQKDTPAGLQKQLQNDQAKLANDQATLKQQQAELAKDEAQLKADQAKLNSITPAEVAQAQQQLTEAQANYNNAVKALNDAQSKANVSNDEVAKAQQNYINALNKLNELKQVLENDEKEIITTSVKWVKNEHPVTTSSMGNRVVLSSSKAARKASATSSKSSNNTVHADTVKAVKAAQGSKVEAENTIHFTSEAPQSSAKKEANKNALPQMGDENSNATVWGEISLAMAGVLATLGLADKKRRN